MLWSKPVATISAPKTKKVMHLEDRAGVLGELDEALRGRRARSPPIAIPQTKAAIRPLPIVTSARPKATRAKPTA